MSFLLIAALLGYFLGAIPVGYLVARSQGVDIFKVGSGNPGSTNVKRVLGAKAGNTVFVLDALKGAVATALPLFCSRMPVNGVVMVQIAGLVGALLGHSFSVFTRFKGGKGVATTAGGLLVLIPVVALISSAIWILVFYSTRYVSLASIIAALALPVATYFHHQSQLRLGLTVLIAVFVVVRHRANIARLLNGTENRFEKKPRPTSAPS